MGEVPSISLLQRNTSNKLSWNILKAFYVAFIQSNNLRIGFGRVFVGVLIENVAGQSIGKQLNLLCLMSHFRDSVT